MRVKSECECVCVPLVVTGILLNCEGMMRTNLEVFHDVAVQPLESQSRCLVLCLFVCFVLAALCLVGLLTYSAGLQPCCYGLFLFFGVLLVVYMPVALRAGASALFDWMHSYSVCRVGVGTGACCKRACCKHACCKVGTLASKLGRWPLIKTLT